MHARLQDVARAGERRVRFTREARELWSAEYQGLTADRPGIYGAVTARAEAQMLRLSLIYALLDEAVLPAAEIIDIPHLRAALAVWKLLRRVGLRHLWPRSWRPRCGRDLPPPAGARLSA